MAWTLAQGTVDPVSQMPVGGCCLAIKEMNIDHRLKTALVLWALWPSKAIRDTGALPAVDHDSRVLFQDSNGTGAQYTPVFGGVPLTQVPNPVTAAAYAALPGHPDLAALLTGAVEC
jgi:hypothetical protein